MFNALQPWHIIILVVVLIALFGAKRLPEAAKGIGKSMRVFKAEAKALREDDDKPAESAQPSQAPTHQAPSQAQIAPPLHAPASTEQTYTETQR